MRESNKYRQKLTQKVNMINFGSILLPPALFARFYVEPFGLLLGGYQ